MAHVPVPDDWREIDPDEIVRVEISRSASIDGAQVRLFLGGQAEPRLFEFDSMASAIAFYERVWSQRAAGGNDSAASHSA